MDLEEALDEWGIMVDTELQRVMEGELENGHRYHPLMGAVYDVLNEFCTRGGKRLAACSTMMTYEGYADGLNDSIVKVAAGVELYRHAILIHDDLVDRDDMRRGGETVHRMMELSLGPEFGEGSSVFIGNILLAIALRSIVRSGFDSSALVEVANLIANEYQAVNESQVLDLAFEYKRPDWGEWEIMASRRAASLFKATLLTGAMLGEAPQEDLKILEKAGGHIGYAFDIQDDIIDTFASRDQYGRDPCGDISKGKKPLHIILAIERDPALGEMIEEIATGNKDLDLEEFRGRIQACGALEEAKTISKMHAESAMEAISSTSMGAGSKEFFQSLIEYITESLGWYNME